jgi:hypothetical protein
MTSHFYVLHLLVAFSTPVLTAHSFRSWAHINMLGEYNFSEETLRDALGILPRKGQRKSHLKTRGTKATKSLSAQ